MEQMDDLYLKLQMFLMKKDAECGKLRFLTSRTTTENCDHVKDVCDSIRNILIACDIPIEEDGNKTDSRCVQAYKYLILNTYFESQEYLTEDLANGHLVDMCPPLSPYLLIEILWSIKYEEIVAESILHLPLDLSVEIIEISRRCLNMLDFHRGLHFLSLLTLNCYKKLHTISKKGAQSTNIEENLEKLMIHTQELIALFCDSKFTRQEEMTDLKKSERLGTTIKRLLSLAKDCLNCGKNGVALESDCETIHKITFGREMHQRPNEMFTTQLTMLDQELIHILWKKFDEMTVTNYIDWVSIEDSANSEITMQRSIGWDCHEFIEFTKNYEHLVKLDALVDRLKVISRKPERKMTQTEMNLEELVNSTANGNRESLKELMKRYDQWNQETFDVVRKNRNLLDKDDFLNLLEYLTILMTKNGLEDHKREVYTIITKVLLRQNISDIYETTLAYIVKHEGENNLESKYTEEMFVKFMSHNKDFKSARNLRILLFFLLKNPRKILGMLLKIAIGDKKYENIMVTPRDLALLSPIMNIREKREETILHGALRQVLLEGFSWNGKKFTHLMQIMLEERLLSSDNVVNRVYLPFLKETNIPLSNVRCVLNNLRKIVKDCTGETKLDELMVTIARRMSFTRNNLDLPKYTINESLSLMTRIVDVLLCKIKTFHDEEKRASLVDDMEKSLRPIEKHHFEKLLRDNCTKIDVYETIREYERRCFLTMNRVHNDPRLMDEEERQKMNLNFERFRNDFLCHLLLKSTEKEYVRFSVEAMCLQWDNLRFANEYDAYDNIARITIEACAYCLEYPELNSPDSFPCLIKSFSRFTELISRLEEMRNFKKIHDSLNGFMRSLDKFIVRTIFSTFYTNFLENMENFNRRKSMRDILIEITQLINDFGNKCLEVSHEEVSFDGEHSDESKRYRIAHQFIEEFLSLDHDDESHASLCKIYKLLSPQQSIDLS